MKKKIVIALIGLLVVLGGGGASAYFLVFRDSSTVAEGTGADGEAVAEETVEQAPAMFHAVPPLVVSANYNGSLHYLQVKLTIMTRDEETLEKLDTNTPLIQDSLIMLLGTYDFKDLEKPEGKEDLRKKAEQKVRELINDKGIASVLFTGFVIQ